MTKRRLSQNQQRRIQLHQQRKQKQALAQDYSDSITPSHNQHIGRLIARYGKSAEILSEDKSIHEQKEECHNSNRNTYNAIYSCDIRPNLPTLVTGDKVVFEITATTKGVIVALLPRTSLLSRHVAGELRAIAANVTQVFIVVAPEPEINWLVLDRYLVGLEQSQLNAAIVLNKEDLPGAAVLEEQLSLYKKIGYPIYKTCAQQPASLIALIQALADHNIYSQQMDFRLGVERRAPGAYTTYVRTRAREDNTAENSYAKSIEQTSIFIGQSGVGKSSLIQTLLPKEQLRTGALSEHSRLGAHTTSTTRLYTLPQGGYLIDSPGIRDFGLDSLQLHELENGFIEFRPYLGHCKFKSCRHLNEPDCAVCEAVVKGNISTQRLKKLSGVVPRIMQKILTCLTTSWRLRQLFTWLGKRLTDTRIKWIKNALIKGFAHYFPINWQEAEYSNIKDYPNFNTFFSRRLKPEARPIDHTPDTLVFPVDGFISEYGDIKEDQLLQAKGFYYGVKELVGDATLAQHFKNGQFITLYLAPQNYHRVHIPEKATLSQMHYIPGRLLSVNAATTKTTPQLFTRNERVVTVFETEHGLMSVIFVAAGLVGSVGTTWAGTVCPPHDDKIHSWQYPTTANQAIHFKRGEEIGYFALGSTVIVLTPEKSLAWREHFATQESVKMGERMANWRTK